MAEKAMVLFSGGVDSTTCLGLAIEKFGKENVIPLSIHYGQKHDKEVEAARKILGSLRHGRDGDGSVRHLCIQQLFPAGAFR